MRPSKPLILFPIAAACLLGLLSAQQEPAAPPAAKPHAEPRVSVQFKGGTLKEYVVAIRAAAEDINIVMPEKADKVQLPPVTLKNASVMSALESVTTVADREDYKVSVRAFAGRDGAAVYAIRVDGPLGGQSPGQNAQASNGTWVMSLRSITEAPPALAADPTVVMSAETVLTAIKAGLAVAGMTPQLKYHQESGLLFVHGQGPASELVHSILRQIESNLVNRRNETLRSQAPKPGASGEASKKPTEVK